jgi:hypothetical protein
VLVRGGAKRTLRHEPGAHDLRIEAPGFAPVVRGVELDGAGSAAKSLAVRLAPAASTGVEDVVADVRALSSAKSAAELAPLLESIARRLDVRLVFEATGALVRLYDAQARAFVAASPLGTADVPTLARAFGALLELRASGERLVARPTPRGRRRSSGSTDKPLWKKWWVWALVLGGAAAVTGGVLLSRQASDDGTLTLRLRRAP